MLLSIQSTIHTHKKMSTKIEPTNPIVNQMAVPMPGHIAVLIIVIAYTIHLYK
jgi:hypothetical protein